MKRPTEAVILMAGSGSRLRRSEKSFLKPLVPILGRPLIHYLVDQLSEAGIRKLTFIVGYEAARLRAAVTELTEPSLDVRFIENPEWRKQNGISVLMAAAVVNEPFVLSMSDHLFGDSIVDRLVSSGSEDDLVVGLDGKIDKIFDLGDAMKVQTRGERLVAIGKDLERYDAIDIGIFVCPTSIFGYLERAKRDGDCSLADGVRLMAEEGKARGFDIGEAWWQDIDTPAMLEAAERKVQSRMKAHVPTL